MLRATFASLLARKFRLILSGLAVILGVAFVSGTYVLTDTMKAGFDSLFTDINSGTSAIVRGKSALGGVEDDREPIPQKVLDDVRRVDGVREAIGYASGYVRVIKPNGKVYTPPGPVFGTTFSADSALNRLRVRQGQPPVGMDQFALDLQSAQRAKLKVGDSVKLLFKGPTRTMRLTALISPPGSDGFGGAQLIFFDPPTGQQLLGKPGTWTELGVAAEPGIDNATLKERIEKVLPKGFEALTQEQSTEETSSEIKDGLSFFNNLLLAFGLIALFVGMFLIFNTFSMLVAQRTRELALMRALGASRGQVMRSVVAEAGVVGLAASVVGFVAGIFVAIGLQKLFHALGIELPGGSAVIRTRTFVVSLLVGVIVTVAAAIVPARRAARVAPVQAMRESGPAEDRSLRVRSIAGAVLLAIGIVVLLLGLNAGALASIGLGAAVTFIGAATLSPLIVRPVVAVLGRPLARLGTPSAMGQGNAMRSPRRTAATASALMIGLALVATASTLGASVKKSLATYVQKSLGADFVLHTDQFGTFSPNIAERLRGKPEIDLVAAYRFGTAKVNGQTVDLQGVEAKPLVATLRVQALSGDITSIDRGRLAVSDKVARARGLTVGKKVDVVWSRTGNKPMTVGAVYADNLFAGDYLVGGAVVDSNVTERLLGVVAVTLKDGVSAKDGRAVVDAAAKDSPDLLVEDQSELIATQRKNVNTVLNFLNIMLLFSVLIAVLGIINTLALSVIERTRELGLLRAVGLSRRQTRRMIRAESVLIAVYGAVLGAVVGVPFGAAIVHALNDQGIDKFAVSWQTLGSMLVGAGVAGVLAAALPARRAARLNVLAAISHE
jgi:putative ABC transport system permease protein